MEPLAAGSTDPLAAVVEAAGAIVDTASAQDLAGLDPEDLRARIGLLGRLEGLAAAGMARTVRALQEAGGVAADGAPSTTAWLKAYAGRSGRDAARVARLAANLDDLPATAAALATGQVTVESADAIVQAARDGRLGSPEQVDTALAPIAVESSPEQLRREVRRRTQAADATALSTGEARQRDRRRLSLTRRDDGMWDLFGRLPSESGDRLRALLDVFDLPDDPETPGELHRRPDQRLADALGTATGVALDHGGLPADGGQSRPHISCWST